MIVCSCTVITDRDIKTALVEIINADDAPIPTPGVVFRHLNKKMNCCGCAPLTVEIIYAKMTELMENGEICPRVGHHMCGRLLRLKPPQTTKKLKPLSESCSTLSLAS